MSQNTSSRSYKLLKHIICLKRRKTKVVMNNLCYDLYCRVIDVYTIYLLKYNLCINYLKTTMHNHDGSWIRVQVSTQDTRKSKKKNVTDRNLI